MLGNEGGYFQGNGLVFLIMSDADINNRTQYWRLLFDKKRRVFVD
jgi:hypothetical protein